MTFFDLLFLFACFCLLLQDLFKFYHLHYKHNSIMSSTISSGKIVITKPVDFFKMIRMKKKK
jgi:hypothetical protein